MDDKVKTEFIHLNHKLGLILARIQDDHLINQITRDNVAFNKTSLLRMQLQITELLAKQK